MCSKCRRVLTPDAHYLDIVTEDETTFYFCPTCVKDGYEALSEKPDRTKDETHLLKGLEEFLKEHRMVAEA